MNHFKKLHILCQVLVIVFFNTFWTFTPDWNKFSIQLGNITTSVNFNYLSSDN